MTEVRPDRWRNSDQIDSTPGSGQRREHQGDDTELEGAGGELNHGELRGGNRPVPSNPGANRMALFFDSSWFDAKLAERGLSRSVMAAVAGMSGDALELAFKDQRELSAAEVAAFAELLGANPAEVASRAGVSTPSPGAPTDAERRIAALERRVVALEAEIARLRG